MRSPIIRALDGATVALVLAAAAIGAVALLRPHREQMGTNDVGLGIAAGQADSIRAIWHTDRLRPTVQAMLASAPTRIGPADAAVTIVVFSDYGCGYCKLFNLSLRHVLARYPDHVAVVFRSFLARPSAAETMMYAAADCAAEVLRFEDFNNMVFAHQRTSGYRNGWRTVADSDSIPDRRKFDQCVESEKYVEAVGADTRIGRSLGVTATPTSFMNGMRLVGARDSLELDSLVARELDRVPRMAADGR